MASSSLRDSCFMKQEGRQISAGWPPAQRRLGHFPESIPGSTTAYLQDEQEKKINKKKSSVGFINEGSHSTVQHTSQPFILTVLPELTPTYQPHSWQPCSCTGWSSTLHWDTTPPAQHLHVCVQVPHLPPDHRAQLGFYVWQNTSQL